MDNRITGKRLSNVLSYDWFKIIIIIAAVALVWSLAFTMGAPRATTGQTFGFFVYSDFQCAKRESDVLQDAKNKGAFSYDVLDFNTRSLTKDYYATVMTASTSVQEGDVFIMSDVLSGEDKNDSVFRSFVDTYGLAYDLNELISDAEKYCLDNYVVVEADGVYTIDEARVRRIFAERMKKDPRFRNKNSQKYKDGEKSEIERFKSVWNNAQKLKQVLEDHPELKVNYKKYTQMVAGLSDDDKTKDDYIALLEKEIERPYALNLGKLTGGKTPITDLYARVLGSGDEKTVTADGIVLCVFDYESYQPDLQYETIGFINYFIENYSNFFDVEFSDLIA